MSKAFNFFMSHCSKIKFCNYFLLSDNQKLLSSYHDVKLILELVLAIIHSLQNRIPLITYMYEYFKFF